MSVEIELSDIDPAPIVLALRQAGVSVRESHRRGFDGIAVTSLAIDAIAAVGTILTPIILHVIATKKPDGEITINGVTLTGLKAEQVQKIVADIAREKAAGGDE